jgi:hypothetical protein
MSDTSFQIDFKDRRVIPTAYSIATNSGSCRGFNLRNWVFEVSDDGREWTVVDARHDDTVLAENNITIMSALTDENKAQLDALARELVG